MKKTLIFLAIIALVSPQIALASWWNPVSWFDREENSSMELDFSTTTNARIIHDTADVRENKNITEPTVDPKRNSSGKDATLLAIAEKEIEVLKETILLLQKEISQLKGTSPKAKEVVREIPVGKIEYRDRVIERPTERIVYKDRAVEKLVTVPTPAPISEMVTESTLVPATATISSPAVVYSDYSFNYQWNLREGGNELSCPTTTPRDVVVKKAVFQIPEGEMKKLNELKTLEADGLKISTEQILSLQSKWLGGANAGVYSVEQKSSNTFVYSGVGIPICGDGGTVLIREIFGSITDLAQGRNITLYLAQKGITVEVKDNTSNQVADANFTLQISPVMSEWEVWDNTTNKPVKVM